MSRRARGAGFTLLGTVMAVALLAVIALFLADGVLVSARVSRELSVENDLLTAAQRGLAEMEDEIRNTSADATQSGIAVTNGGAGLQFRTIAGFDTTANAPVWSGLITYRWELAPGERDNGIDDDGNGLVDEGRLVRLDERGAKAVLIDAVAKSPAFTLATAGGRTTLTLDLTVLRVVSEPRTGRSVRRRAVSTTLRLAD
jgi:type II secretory pathway pseudopilin PulG